MRISILCPTRGRIDRVRLMRDSALLTARRPRDLEFVFYIDHDDESMIRRSYLLLRTVVEVPTLSVQVIINSEDINLSEKWDVCWKYASGDIFMLAADDIVFRTKGWDQKVIEKFLEIPDRIGYVYCHDGAGQAWRRFGTHGFVHKNWTDVLGYFAPPHFERRCTDSWLDFLGKQLKRHYGIQDVMIEHMWYGYRKSESDATYDSQKALGHAYKPIWHNSYKERMGEVAKLQKFIEEFDEGNSDKSA